MKRLSFTLLLILVVCSCYVLTSREAAALRAPQTIWLAIAVAQPQPTIPPSPAMVRIEPSCCQFVAPGGEQDNLNGEYVCLRNLGDAPAQLAGWQVRDRVGTTYTFPAFILVSKASVKLHTGIGTNIATDLYWGRRSAVWNNDGDTVFLYDASANLVDDYSYTLPN
jgi:hypothetical protein